MAKKNQVILVALKDLKKNLFVRTELNHDHVLMLADLIRGGVKLPPIEITLDNTVIDGRHRIEAYELNKIFDLEATVTEDVTEESDLIVRAFKANTGGSLPPTRQDTEHTIMLLIDRGVPKKQIGDSLGLPAGMARRYIEEVQSRAKRAQLLRAAAAVAEKDVTVSQAADDYKVDIDDLKEVMSGRRRKQRRGGVAQARRTLTTTYRSLASKNAALLRGILEKFKDGEVSKKQVEDLLDHLESLQRLAAKTLTERRGRFTAMVAEAKRADSADKAA